MKMLSRLRDDLLASQGHLNASTLSQAFLRPIALITDADNALHTPPDNRAARDKDLLDSVVSTLRKGGLLLLPRLLSSMASSLVPLRCIEAACMYCCRVLQDAAELHLKSLETVALCRGHAAAGDAAGWAPKSAAVAV